MNNRSVKRDSGSTWPRSVVIVVRAACRWLLAVSTLTLAAANPVINKYSDLNAGSTLAGASAGTVALNSPSGTRSTTGGTELGNSVGVALGRLTLSGKPGDSWAIRSHSAIPFNLTRIGGGTLPVTAIDFELSTTGKGTFPSSGTTAMFYLGASITVGTSATTPQGTYSGSFSLLLDNTSHGGGSTTKSFLLTLRVDPVITLTQNSELSFGDIYSGSRAGTVILAPDGKRTTTGGLLTANLSPVSAAGFVVNGAANCTYAVMLPAGITLIGPAGTMLVASFTSSPPGSGLLGTAGRQQLDVGATLNVAANQADGDYRGTFTVTVAYN